jgi:hypothetical protein
MKLTVAVALLAAPLLAACPKPRTSAATQPTPAAFDPAKSDPKALAAVDAGIAALGGYAQWEKLQELQFGIQIQVDGVMKSQFRHWWDRWNGRHFYVATDMATVGGKPDEVGYLEIKHDLFDLGKLPEVKYNGAQLTRSDSVGPAKAATTQLIGDLYMLAIIYKVKDPGVILTIDNAEVIIAEDVPACKPSCTSVKVSFEAGVGKDTWYVNYNNTSKLPEVIEQARGAGRIGYLLQDWVESGGLKWPTKLQNIGFKGEVIQFDGVKVGSPDDNRYEVQVQ